MDRKRNIRRIGGGYFLAAPEFQHPIMWGLSRSIKALLSDAVVVIEYE